MHSQKYITTPLGRMILNPGFEIKPVIRLKKLLPAVWKITDIFSLLINASLFSMLLSLGNQLFYVEMYG